MATTRGLDETPYFGSTLLERPDEAQLASRRQAETTAIPRPRSKETPKQASETGADRLIRIGPKCCPIAIPPTAFPACLADFVPDAVLTARINKTIYRSGNTAEMGRARGWQRLVNQSFARQAPEPQNKFPCTGFWLDGL